MTLFQRVHHLQRRWLLAIVYQLETFPSNATTYLGDARQGFISHSFGFKSATSRKWYRIVATSTCAPQEVNHIVSVWYLTHIEIVHLQIFIIYRRNNGRSGPSNGAYTRAEYNMEADVGASYSSKLYRWLTVPASATLKSTKTGAELSFHFTVW